VHVCLQPDPSVKRTLPP